MEGKMFFVSLITVIITVSTFALVARILIAYWIYKDAQERNDLKIKCSKASGSFEFNAR